MGFQNHILLIFMISLIIGEYGNCRIVRDPHHHRLHHLYQNSTTKILYDSKNSFVQRNDNHFVLNGKPYYLNGFNAYWLMSLASDPSSSSKVTTAFQEASQQGLNVARTWAFNDGGDKPLQIAPGYYNENVFKGLDFVISEAGKNGVRVILSLVNNWNDYGGKNKYVQWAKERGQNVNNDDDFFTHPIVKQYYKNHINTVLTRKNTINGIIYKDDPAIFAWELMNEPRCQTRNSGKSFQAWVEEMATYVKTIDKKHLLEVGLEGFYGESMPEKKQINPGGIEVGTDFISNNQVPQVDFATIHLYPDQWLSNSNEIAQEAFGDKWVEAHIEDSNNVLKKPIVVTEFGKSTKSAGYNVDKRNSYFERVYNWIYKSASSGGSCAGGLYWQLMVPGMKGYGDGYEVIFQETPSTANVIAQQSQKISSL